MRPLRLELEGFTAYREYTVLDFEGAELFVLTGPTGSGKSSLIDAITFALYGSVARYQNPNLVHPVVSQGKLEARVRFDFAVDGRTYTAVRVVRKNPKGGATTREARLESGDRVLAGSADEVSARVREILGLSFDQFITCVVLPQGEFARFLHETPADRQDLLTKLIGVEIYARMGSLARLREASFRQAAKLVEDELERLRHVSPEAKSLAEKRVSDLEGLQKSVEAAEPELERLKLEAEAGAAEAERLERDAALLAKLASPDGVDELGTELERARAELERARAKRIEADAALARAEEERSAMPAAGVLHELDRARRDREAGEKELSKRREEAGAARESLERAEAALESAGRRLQSAREAVDGARRELAAHDLASHLKSGEPCPVCGQRVARRPAPTLPPALSKAERALELAAEENQEAERSYREASTGATRANERLEAIERELRALEAKLAGSPEADAIESALKLDREIVELRRKQRDAREAEERFTTALEELRGRERRAWAEFDAARDRLAAMEPPPAERASLGGDWNLLRDWAARERASREAAAGEARSLAGEAKTGREAKIEALRESCRALGVAPRGERVRDAVVNARASAAAELTRIQDALDRAEELRARLASAREAAEVAGALGQHLRATGFERWLLGEAFRRLAEGATAILRDLSSGQYSFAYDDRLNFEVVDHRNADERRSARTLSGGETFLASLALALTLAEQTAELAAEGSARLESLFLDEGFGTLDDDTLEVVAAAIEELGAKGRIVGLVTHQQNLAEKIPVQFRVSKGPVTATVERVVA